VASPEARHIRRVAGHADAQLFILSGYSLYRNLSTLLQFRFGRELTQFRHILDWGCGVGRLTRFLACAQPRQERVFAADIDTDNTGWCRDNLTGVITSTIDPVPPTPFSNDFFDLIIGNSVFTHLDRNSQLAWLQELHRISTEDVLVLVSVHSVVELLRATLSPATMRRLLSEGFHY